MKDHQDLIAAYLKHHASKSDDDFGAWEVVDELCREDPEEAILFTLGLIDPCNSDAELFYVAAGPVQDLLWYHGRLAFPAFREASARSAKVLNAINAADLDESDEVFADWKEFLEQSGSWKET